MSMGDYIGECKCPFLNGEECIGDDCAFYILEDSECGIRSYLAGEMGYSLPSYK